MGVQMTCDEKKVRRQIRGSGLILFLHMFSTVPNQPSYPSDHQEDRCHIIHAPSKRGIALSVSKSDAACCQAETMATVIKHATVTMLDQLSLSQSIER